MKHNYEKTVDNLVKEIEFMKTFHTITTEVFLSMIKDLYLLHSEESNLKAIKNSISGLMGIRKEKKEELSMQKLFDKRFSEKYGQIIGVSLETNESVGVPTIIKYSREEKGKVFNFKFVEKDEEREEVKNETPNT